MSEKVSTLAELIDAYRVAEKADDAHTMNVTSDAIWERSEPAMWALLDEKMARAGIARLTAVGRSTRQCEIMLANALAIIDDELNEATSPENRPT